MVGLVWDACEDSMRRSSCSYLTKRRPAVGGCASAASVVPGGLCCLVCDKQLMATCQCTSLCSLGPAGGVRECLGDASHEALLQSSSMARHTASQRLSPFTMAPCMSAG